MLENNPLRFLNKFALISTFQNKLCLINLRFKLHIETDMTTAAGECLDNGSDTVDRYVCVL